MKRITIALTILLFSFYSFAQEHLFFKGIPITGRLDVFSAELLAKGFHQEGEDYYMGMVADYDNCMVKLVSYEDQTEHAQCISGVIIIFSNEKKKNKVAVEQFNRIASILSLKYDKPKNERKNMKVFEPKEGLIILVKDSDRLVKLTYIDKDSLARDFAGKIANAYYDL